MKLFEDSDQLFNKHVLHKSLLFLELLNLPIVSTD